MLIPLLLDLGQSSGTIGVPQSGTAPCVWQYSNYQAFRANLLQLIDGDDISTSAISTAVLDLMVMMGEKRIYRDVRSSTQDTTLSLTTTNNSAPLPIDLLELSLSSRPRAGRRPTCRTSRSRGGCS